MMTQSQINSIDARMEYELTDKEKDRFARIREALLPFDGADNKISISDQSIADIRMFLRAIKRREKSKTESVSKTVTKSCKFCQTEFSYKDIGRFRKETCGSQECKTKLRIERHPSNSKHTILDDHVLLYTSNGICTKIDKDDFERVRIRNWYGRMRGTYADFHTSIDYKMTSLPRFILGITDSSVFVDHINGDTLDNRRCNLRIATPQQNSWNSKKRGNKKYKGVFFQKDRGNFAVAISIGNKERKHLGRYKDQNIAAIVYNIAAMKYHKEFARYNKIVL